MSATDGVIIAADKDVDRSRFAGKKVLAWWERCRWWWGFRWAVGGASKGRSVAYKALMNGVSYMIPFVVVGGRAGAGDDRWLDRQYRQ